MRCCRVNILTLALLRKPKLSEPLAQHRNRGVPVLHHIVVVCVSHAIWLFVYLLPVCLLVSL